MHRLDIMNQKVITGIPDNVPNHFTLVHFAAKEPEAKLIYSMLQSFLVEQEQGAPYLCDSLS